MAGELVAFPTETVYGLGADATNPIAVAKIFAAKRRPSFNPLIVHVPEIQSLTAFAHLTPLAESLASAFWPGPLTLVLQLKDRAPIANLTVAGLATVAVRIPSHPVATALLKGTARPIAAPSANLSGRVSASTAQHVAADLADADPLILDAGPSPHGLESTIIDATGNEAVILRHGAVTAEDILSATGNEPRQHSRHGGTKNPSAPGQLASHYAPGCKVMLDRMSAGEGEALLGFGPGMPGNVLVSENLSPSGSLLEAAANLFAALRRLDRPDVAAIAVMPIPDHGLGAAINDRLRRAAAPRD